MTRKEFIKTLMAMGSDRNSAAAKARGYNAAGKSYEYALEVERFWAAFCANSGEFVNRMNEALEKVAGVATEIVNRLADMLSTIDWEAMARYAEQAGELGEEDAL